MDIVYHISPSFFNNILKQSACLSQMDVLNRKRMQKYDLPATVRALKIKPLLTTVFLHIAAEIPAATRPHIFVTEYKCAAAPRRPVHQLIDLVSAICRELFQNGRIELDAQCPRRRPVLDAVRTEPVLPIDTVYQFI